MENTERKELTLKQLQDIEFNLLKEFSSFCKKNNIRYFLAYGTLLGAIRYKGFIPWDDDVDVLVPRKDYDRFIKSYKDNGNFKLYSVERNEKFGYPFAKLCDMTTLKTEGQLDNGVRQGVDIDVFPIDYWNDDIKKAKAEVRKLKRNRFFLNMAKLTSIGKKSTIKRFGFRCLHAVGKLFGEKFWLGKIKKIGCFKSNPESRYAGNKMWFPYNEKEIMPAGVFADSVEIEFEGEKFPAPIGYDTYLTCLYGDYLPEPPKEKQKTHHSFTAYRLTEEELREKR